LSWRVRKFNKLKREWVQLVRRGGNDDGIQRWVNFTAVNKVGRRSGSGVVVAPTAKISIAKIKSGKPHSN